MLSSSGSHSHSVEAEPGQSKIITITAGPQRCSAHICTHRHSSKLSQDTNTGLPSRHTHTFIQACSLSYPQTPTPVAARRERWTRCLGILWALPHTNNQFSSSPAPVGCLTIQSHSEANHPEQVSDPTGRRALSPGLPSLQIPAESPGFPGDPHF